MAYIDSATAADKSNRAILRDKKISGLRKNSGTNSGATAELIDPNKPLTEKQALFAKYYAEGDTIPVAMTRAGYNEQPSYGYRMIKMPNVKREIAKHHAAFVEASQLTKKSVIDMHKEAFEMAKLMSEPATMVSAAREIGKMCGFYEPQKVQVDVNMSGSVKLERLTDQQLFAMIEKASRKLEEIEKPLLDAPKSADDDITDV